MHVRQIGSSKATYRNLQGCFVDFLMLDATHSSRIRILHFFENPKQRNFTFFEAAFQKT